MSLVPKIGFIVVKSSTVILYDKTGNYNVDSNPGGFGAPNPTKAGITNIMVQYSEYGQESSVLRLLTGDEKTAYLNYTGVKLLEGTLPDAVYEVKILLGYTGASNITATGISGAFSMANAASIFADAVGFTIDSFSASELYLIDRTRVLNGTGGYATKTVPAATNEAVTVFYEGKAYILVYDQGENCLVTDIANADISCGCAKDKVDELMERYAQMQSMIYKYGVTQDYSGANALAKKLHADCSSGCLPCDLYGSEEEASTSCVPPGIIIQPVDVTLNAGNNATFTVQASGTGPLSYQWYKNNIAIAGEVNPTLVLLNTTNADEADYKCVVSNSCGTVESDVATLEITAGIVPLTIVQHPQSITLAEGGTATFNVAATGTAPITYQWRKDGVNMVGETNSYLEVTGVDSGDEGYYDVVVTNPAGSVISDQAQLSLGVIAKVGWRNSLPVLPADIDALQTEATFVPGETITADFTANAVPQYLIMAEPATEPVKSSWYANVLNNGSILSGTPPEETTDVLFYVLGVIGSYRVYVTFYPTYNTEDQIEFRV